jgi:hypothetical protein
MTELGFPTGRRSPSSRGRQLAPRPAHLAELLPHVPFDYDHFVTTFAKPGSSCCNGSFVLGHAPSLLDVRVVRKPSGADQFRQGEGAGRGTCKPPRGGRRTHPPWLVGPKLSCYAPRSTAGLVPACQLRRDAGSWCGRTPSYSSPFGTFEPRAGLSVGDVRPVAGQRQADGKQTANERQTKAVRMGTGPFQQNSRGIFSKPER